VRKGRVVIKINDKGIGVEFDGDFNAVRLCQAVVAFAHSVQEILQRKGMANKPIVEEMPQIRKED